MIRDLSTDDDEIVSTDPVETVRVFARLRLKSPNLDPVTIHAQAGKDPADGRLKQATLTLPLLVAMADEIERLRDQIEAEEISREVAREHARETVEP